MALKQSTSTTSLTHLTEGCTFCTEGADEEAGRGLVDSKQIVQCTCQFMVHRDCWYKYLESKAEHTPIECPSCKRPVRTLREGAEEELYKQTSFCSTRTTLISTFLVGLCLIAFVAGFTIPHP